MNKLQKIAEDYKKLLKKAQESPEKKLGTEYYYNFEGMLHQALLALAEGMTYDAENPDLESHPEIKAKYVDLANRKAEFLRQTAKAALPFDREYARLDSELGEAAYGEGISMEEFEESYPELKE